MIKKWNSMLERVQLFWSKYEIYFIVLLLSYLLAVICISVIWYVLELAILHRLNQNQEDTRTTLLWSLGLMLPIFWGFVKKIRKLHQA